MRAPRRVALFAAVLALAAGACSSLRVGHVRPQASDWRTEGAEGTRTHAWPGTIDAPLERAWRYDARAGFGPASPVVLDGRVLLGTRQGEVHVVELASGKRLATESFGDAIDAAPFMTDGLLIIALEAGRRTLVGYDLRRGTTRWRDRRTGIRATPLGVGEVVVAADVDGTVFALDAATGAERWSHAAEPPRAVAAALVRLPDGARGPRVAVAGTDGRVKALGIDGRAEWEAQLEPVYSTPAAADGRLFVSTTRGTLHALDAATGETRWRVALGDSLARVTSPAVLGEQVFVASSSGDVVGLDARTGAERWRTPLGEAVVAAPLVSAGVLYVGGTDRHLYALDRATGAILERYQLDGRVKSAMAAVPGGVLVLAEPSYLYLYRMSGARAVGG